MTAVNITGCLQEKLNAIIDFLEPHLDIANSHMVNFITNNLWKAHIPAAVKTQVSAMSSQEAYEVLWKWGNSGEVFEDSSPLGEFLQKSWSMSLRSEKSWDFLLDLKGLEDRLSSLGLKKEIKLDSIQCYMSPKKSHEVEILTRITAAIAQLENVSCIVDIGGGKGYLGSCLALQHGLRVLNIDSSQSNAHGAAHLSKKIEVVWSQRKNKSKLGKQDVISEKNEDSIWASEEVSQQINKETRGPENIENMFKQVTAFISSDSDLAGMVAQHFLEKECEKTLSSMVGEQSFEHQLIERHRLCLAGLHTCGNLSSSCLRILCSNSDVKSLCNVGCCYNLITEEFEMNTLSNAENLEPKCMSGFPMSMFLRSKKFTLGRNARMLACQSIDRIAQEKRRMPDATFYRAMLEVLLVKHSGDGCDNSVGRIGSKSKNLHDYVYKALKRLNMDLKVSDEDINDLVRIYGNMEPQLHIFFIIRVALGPVIETVILLDRLLYLHEQGFVHAYLSRLFDPALSPRCYGLVALKI